MKIFAVAFGMGVVSGIAMSYQFGTNWSVFSDRAGPIIGPLMTYEVLTAFFMEAGFLGVMLFGMGRVSKSLHVVATGIVAAGTLVSAFWILAVNSWMHTPAGFAINGAGQFVPDNWFAIVFNPSFPFRLVHMVLAAYLTTALVVGGVGAFHLLRERTNAEARKMFSMAMWMVAIIAPLQVVAGDLHGLNTLQHQPVKVMAMEGHYESYPQGAPLFLFGLPNEADQRLDHAIGIPRMTAALAALLAWGLMTKRDTVPFPASIGLFGLCFAGLGIGLHPYIVPRAISIQEAAAPDGSLQFMLIGAAILLPMILAYTAYSYWVFRGKVDPDAGYH